MKERVTKTFADLLLSVDKATAQRYEELTQSLLGHVNISMRNRDDLREMIGNNPVDVMFANHACHVEFMASVFRNRSAATFVDTVSWVYQSYMSRGFARDYFVLELREWVDAIKQYFPPVDATPILAFYDQMIDSHEDFIKLAELVALETRPDDDAKEYYDKYLAAILRPSSQEAVEVSKHYIKEVDDVPFWWTKVIQPAMHEVGRLWADGKITVGQEHLATSITQRVMSVFYPLILELPREKGKVVFSTSPGELHEIGPRMVADFLEMRGWDVFYTGADTPTDSVQSVIEQSHADVLCVSTTLPFNLTHTERLILQIKDQFGKDGPHVLVGGQAYMNDRDLWQTVGADGFAGSADSAVKYLESIQN